MKKLFLCLTLFLSGCGFHLRQPSDLPNELHHLQLQTNNVNNAITSALTSELKAFAVTLDNQAPILLQLSNSKTDTNIPIVFNANANTVYNYRLSVTVTLSTATGKEITHERITASEDILHNVNQVSPPVFTPLMRSTLNKKLVDNIFDFLNAKQTIDAINQALKPQQKDHAK